MTVPQGVTISFRIGSDFCMFTRQLCLCSWAVILHNIADNTFTQSRRKQTSVCRELSLGFSPMKNIPCKRRTLLWGCIFVVILSLKRNLMHKEKEYLCFWFFFPPTNLHIYFLFLSCYLVSFLVLVHFLVFLLLSPCGSFFSFSGWLFLFFSEKAKISFHSSLSEGVHQCVIFLHL